MRAARAFRKERTQDQTRATGVARLGRAELHDLSQMAGASTQVQQQQHLQRLSDSAQQCGVLQGKLYPSHTFKPDGTTQSEFNKLDAKVATAEANAKIEVTSTTKTATDTAKQMNYKRRPGPTTWGYVVEEQLDIEARKLGWNTQNALKGGRPDYTMKVDDVTLFADLTTEAQAGVGGPHVTGKLGFAYQMLSDQGTAPNWHAVDIAHSGAQPGQTPAPLVVTGEVKDEHDRWFGKFKAALSQGSYASYDPWVEAMKRKYGNKLPHSKFYGSWGTKQRDGFVETAVQLDARYNVPDVSSGGGKVKRSSRLRGARFKGAYPY